MPRETGHISLEEEKKLKVDLTEALREIAKAKKQKHG